MAGGGDALGGWRGRPWSAALVRAFAAGIPVAAGVAAAIIFSRLIDPPFSGAGKAVWFVSCLAVSTVVSWLVSGQARRLLPLAALLKLSMAFPDKAPSRFSVALRAGTIGNLKARVAHVRDHGIDSDAASAAETILVLASALNAHDKGTRGHAERVRALTEMLGEELRLDPDDIDRLRWSSLLHDVGKVMVSPEILNKTGSLTDEEWEVIHRHPDDGARIAAPLQDWLGPWGLAIEQHHEKYDGTGYPRQLEGDEISYAARIVAVADAYEVMTSARSYREPMSPSDARKELARSAGTHFDPVIVRAFLNISIGRLRWLMGPLSWLAQFPFIRPLVTTTGQAASAAGAAATGVATVAASVGMGLVPTTAPVSADVAAPRSQVIVGAGPAPGVSAAGSGAGVPAGGAAAPVPVTAAPTTAPRAAVPTTRVTVTAPAPTTTTRPNRAPIASDDSAVTSTGPSKPIKIDVAGNDSDPDDNLDVTTLQIVSPGQLGKANGGADGRVNYIPTTTEAGVDTFRYRICDTAGACDEATVTVTITGPPPTTTTTTGPTG